MNKNYTQFFFEINDREKFEILMAQLMAIGFEGFEELPNQIHGYILSENLNKKELKVIIDKYNIKHFESIINNKNWNQLWETNFHPVIIDDFVGIRASFHTPLSNIQHEIIITPKMSFGTGHHATTNMMIRQMRNIDFNNKKVMDFGTGTGILSIVAEKLGANKVVAIDYDEWSIENTKENFHYNGCSKISVIKQDTAKISDSFDVILANINKNIILDNFSYLKDALTSKAYLLLSGLLTEDEPIIIHNLKAIGISPVQTIHQNQWTCLLCNKT